MSQIWIIFASCFLSGVVSLTQPSYVIREQRTDLKSLPLLDDGPPILNKYAIILSEENVQVEKPTESSFLDYVLSPVNAAINIGSRIVPFTRWLLVNGLQVLLGIAMTITLCTFTSTCTITLQSPFGTRTAMPYLDDIKQYFDKAYDKHNNIENETDDNNVK